MLEGLRCGCGSNAPVQPDPGGCAAVLCPHISTLASAVTAINVTTTRKATNEKSFVCRHAENCISGQFVPSATGSGCQAQLNRQNAQGPGIRHMSCVPPLSLGFDPGFHTSADLSERRCQGKGGTEKADHVSRFTSGLSMSSGKSCLKLQYR